MDEVKEAARLASYNPAVLADLAEMKGLTVSVQDGRPVVRPTAEPDAAPQLLQDYIREHLADYLPALTTGAVLEEHLERKRREVEASTDPLNP